MRAVLVLVAIVASTSMVQAQLTDAVNTVYANFGDDYYLAVAQVASGASGQVGVSDQTPQEQDMLLDPALSSTAALDMSKTIEIVACFDTNAAISGLVPVLLGGQISVTTEVRQGTTLIASGESQDVLLVPSMVGKATWTVTPAVASIDPAAGNLEWYLNEGGAATGALFIPDCGDGTWSHVTFPVLPSASAPGAGQPVRENLTGPSVRIEKAFSSPTNGSFVYGWTSTFDKVRVQYSGQVTAGSVKATLRDGSGAVVHVIELSQSNQGSKDLPRVQAGLWNISVDFQAFKGNFTLTLFELPGSSASTSASHSSSSISSSSATGPSTGGFPLRHEKNSPAVAPVVVASALLGLTLLARRRVR